MIRRSRPEKELLEAVPQDTNIDHVSSKPSHEGLLKTDSGLWLHIAHARTNIQPLDSPTEQVEQLAKWVGKWHCVSCVHVQRKMKYRYVCEQLGGAVERSGPLGFELPAGHIQVTQESNLVPLGGLKVGTFQQRALLFKVRCWVIKFTLH